MLIHHVTDNAFSKSVFSLLAIFTLLVIACGSPAATATPLTSDNSTNPQPTATAARPSAGDIVSTPTPASLATATPQPAETSGEVVSAKDSIVLVTPLEPDTLGAWDDCGPNVVGFVCTDATVDPLTWIDNNFREVVGTSGTESWEQLDPDRWRFHLREGVKFQTGEPWNAAAAKRGIDINGTPGELEGYSFHGDIEGEIVDDMTIDVQCLDNDRAPEACPIFPRTAAWTSFQAPEWYDSATEDERIRRTLGFGPYRMLDWEPSVKITLEAYEDYLPNPVSEEMAAPTIQNATQIWRNEEVVRAAMVQTGEADWAADMGFDSTDSVPKVASGFNNEIFALLIDTVWHPELRKKEVRMALAHAINCEALVNALYGGLVECWGNMSAEGTAGITPENSAPYEYNPEMAKQLLEEAGYDPANEIKLYTRDGRVQKDVEFYEGVIGYWREIGVNVSLNIIENSVNSQLNQTGCGRTEDPIRCHEFGPPPQYNASPHTIFTATSNEILDYSRQARLRSSCFATRSKICDHELERLMEEADPIPLGPERTAALEAIATRVHDEYYYIPHYQVTVVYGLAENLEWTPRYDPRVRVNAMRFTQ
ncbi:MAG TPA: ABC transporter substrate-binding protein [Dehalococcoidia bacterium]|nr:ABC transporter substrate-binding protein [Dehalococcoidia bacterium]